MSPQRRRECNERDRRSLTTSNPSPNSAHPLPMNNKPPPVSVKVEMGTSEFILIKWPSKYFYLLRYYLKKGILITFTCFGRGVLLFLSPVSPSSLVVIFGLRLVSNCVRVGTDRFSYISFSELPFIIYRRRDIGRF